MALSRTASSLGNLSIFTVLSSSYAAAPTTSTNNQCDVKSFQKVDCHQTSQDQCEAASCCWQSVSPNPGNEPWCYQKAGSAPTCSLGGHEAEPFSQDEMAEIGRLFAANLDVQNSGMVVAAQDHNTGPGGDYYFDWMRDGALSMNAFLETSSSFTSEVEQKMDHWLAWVERSYQQSDPHGDVMAEPKFLIPSGEPFPGGWCRPQTDGPGLRAITLMAYAKAKPAVGKQCWALVQKQLDWVAANYSSDGCDLWEEVHSGDFFWNRYTMRKALLQGADFAETVGQDVGRADSYKKTAQTITEALQQHVDPSGYVFESENRRLDTAVIEAFNVGDMADGTFAPLSKEVVTTLEALTGSFCNAFQVNQEAAAAKVAGVLYGRYPGDSYDGGNPWILLTASVATLLYRQSEVLAKGATVPADSAQILGSLLSQDVSAASLLAAGDTVLLRMKKFLTNGLHMNEQIDRNTGALTSAKDLTWNYANVLKAMKARQEAKAALGETRHQEVFIMM